MIRTDPNRPHSEGIMPSLSPSNSSSPEVIVKYDDKGSEILFTTAKIVMINNRFNEMSHHYNGVKYAVTLTSPVTNALKKYCGRLDLIDPIENDRSEYSTYKVSLDTLRFAPHDKLRKSLKNIGTTAIAISPLLAEKMGLIADEEGMLLDGPVNAVLRKTLSPGEQLMWEAQYGTAHLDNKFGRKNKFQSYVGTGLIASGCADPILGRPAVFLSEKQVCYLGYKNFLRPICGEDRYEQLQRETPDAIGLAKVWYDDKSIIVDVYEQRGENHCDTPCMSISGTLIDNLGGSIIIGAKIQVSSLLHCQTAEEAAGYKITDLSLLSIKNCTTDFISALSSNEKLSEILKKLQPNHPVDRYFVLEDKNEKFDEDRIFIRTFLEEMIQKVDKVVQNPRIFLNVFGFINNFTITSKTYDLSIKKRAEYKVFYSLVKERFAELQKNQNNFLKVWLDEFNRGRPDLYTSKFVKLFLKLGLVPENGDNLFHLLFRREGLELHERVDNLIAKDLLKSYRDMLFVRNAAGETPMHFAIACSNPKALDKKLIIKCIKQKGPEYFVSNCNETPLHYAFTNPNKETLKLFYAMAEEYPEWCEKWLYTESVQGKKPIQLLPLPSLLTLLDKVIQYNLIQDEKQQLVNLLQPMLNPSSSKEVQKKAGKILEIIAPEVLEKHSKIQDEEFFIEVKKSKLSIEEEDKAKEFWEKLVEVRKIWEMKEEFLQKNDPEAYEKVLKEKAERQLARDKKEVFYKKILKELVGELSNR